MGDRFVRLVISLRSRSLLVVFVALVACRAPRASSGEDAPDGSDGGAPPDTRTEPPIVTPAVDIMVETVAGSSAAGEADGEPSLAMFSNPVGVLLEPSGALIVTEYDGGRVRRIPPSGPTTTLWRGLHEPFASFVTEDAIYIQTDRNRIGEKGPTTGTLWKLSAAGGEQEAFIEGLGRPRGLARLLDGRVVVADRDRHVVSILDLATKAMTPLAGSGQPGFVAGRGEAARFNEPYGVAVLPDGNVLVADARNHCIRRVTLEGDVTVYAGDGSPGMKDDPDKAKARFDGPVDVAVDVAGNAFISDGGNHRIRRISTAGAVETVAGDGTRGFADGIGANAKFYGQEQLDVSPDGKTIYVSDGNGGDGEPYHRIRRIRVP